MKSAWFEKIPLMRQRWSNIVWCHWPVDPEQVARLLPPGLTPHTFEGRAWVGLIPFSMSNLRLTGPFGIFTRLLRGSDFGEVNVRTYVVGPDGDTGVWFCTLDADSRAAVAVANAAFGLPYRVAKTKFSIEGTVHRWTSVRLRDRARALVVVSPTQQEARPSAPGLESFLFERYSLYSRWHGKIVRGRLSHEPWRIRPAEPLSIETQTLESAGFSVSGEPHVFIGDPVEVTVFPMRILRARRP